MDRRTLLAAAGGLSAALVVPRRRASAATQKVITYGHTDALAGIDIYPYSSQINQMVAKHVWDQLVYANPDTGEIKGLIASSWQQIDDKTWEFKLRRDIKFHDGSPLTAEDVAFTVNYFTSSAVRVIDVALIDWIAKAEKVDDYTIRIISKNPFPPALEYMSKSLYIYPKDYYQRVGAAGMNDKPVGSGPYRVLAYEKGKVVRLERFKDYVTDGSKRVPTIERLDIRLIPDQQTLLAELLSGGVDLALLPLPPDQVAQLKSVPTLSVKSTPTTRVLFIQFDLRPESAATPLLDPRVRQAFAQAIDRKAIATQILGDGAEVLNAVCVASQFGCTATADVYPFDPAAAKKLLADAGYPNGFTIPFYAHRERPVAEAIINYLRNVGIRAELNFMQLPALRELKYQGKVPIHFLTWGSYGIYDVSSILPVYFGGSRDDLVNDKEVQGLIAKAGSSLQPQEREEAYRQANTVINKKTLAIPVVASPTNFIGSSQLAFKAYRDEYPRFWEMDLKG